MRPKKNGGWDKPFDAREVNNNFTEGNSWQYSFFVPQDIPGMIDAYGGKAGFEQKLDEMFSAPSQTTGREQADITGLIGQYAHGNEPSHHMAYLYNYIGKPEKAQEKIKFILKNFYKNAPDGLIGNEDCGQMSAWYVLSSLGLYNVTPAGNEWTMTQSAFENATIKMEDGSQAKIGKAVKNPNLNKLGFDKNAKAAPELPFEKIVPVPVIEAAGKSFSDKLLVSLQSSDGKPQQIEYILEPRVKKGAVDFQPYQKPFYIDESSTVTAVVKDGKSESNRLSANFYRKPNDYAIEIKSTYSKQYHAGGPDGLLDGILGSENWRKGDWQGYQAQDFEAVVDLRKTKKISKIDARFLQDSRAWILMPTKVEYYISDDNRNFKLAKTVENTYDAKNTDVKVVDFTAQIAPTSAKYVKVKAFNFGKLPQWHQGAGGDAYLFIDEITID
jgi:hypothetical protein